MNRFTPRTFCLTALALACAAALPVRATTLLVTDATWKVTATAPAAGWNTLAAFDTSSWQSATVLYDVSDYLGPDYSSKGIWASGQFSYDTAIWARQVWHLDSLPLSASLLGGFDDDVDLYINGALVISNHDGLASNVSAGNLLPYLQLGDNVVAYAATDNYLVYGYNHASWVQIEGQVAAPVPEPQTYALMLAGLAAVGGVVRRRGGRYPAPVTAPGPVRA